MNVKIVRTVLGIMLVLSLLLTAACGTVQENTGDSESTTGKSTEPVVTEKIEPQTLTLATFNQWNTGGMTAGIKKYEEISGNKIEVQIYPDDQFKNLIKTKLATGDVPDLIAYLPNIGDLGWEKLEPLDGPWVNRINNVKNIYRFYCLAQTMQLCPCFHSIRPMRS